MTHWSVCVKRLVLAQLCSVTHCLPWPAGVVGGIVAAAVLALVAFFVIRRYRRSRNRTAAERSAKARRAPKKPAARGGHSANGTNGAPFLDSPRKSESSTGGSGTSGSPIMKKSALPGEPGSGDCSMGANSPCISGCVYLQLGSQLVLRTQHALHLFILQLVAWLVPCKRTRRHWALIPTPSHA